MKKIFTNHRAISFCIMIMALFNLNQSFAQLTVDFETLNDGYTASATEGASPSAVDIFNRTQANIGGNSTFIWAVEDTNINPGTLTLDQIDVTGQSNFVFSIDFLTPNTNDWDATDELVITYSIDGGGSQNLMAVQHIPDDDFNEPAALDLDFDGDGDAGEELPAITDGHSAGVGSSFATFTTNPIVLSSNTTLDIVLSFAGMTSADEGIYLDNISVTFNASASPEPSNHVTSFSASASSASQIDLTWTDNDGANVADGFLILASTGTITAPIDGVDPSTDSDLSDGSASIEISAGTGSHSFSGLTPSTSYNFEIYPFSNAGSSIDFKTDATVPSQTTATNAATYNPGDIVITELHYNPSAAQGGDSDFEFLELHNTTGSTINLENWTFTSGVTHTFTVSDEITAGGYIVLATNSANYSGSIDLDGGGLTNSGETVTLESNEAVTIDEVTYNTSEVDAPNGDGYTLSLVDITADNSNMDFWIGSGTDGGTPGAANTDITIWNGSSSTAWETDGNWDNDAPTTGISAFIPIGASSPTITGNEVAESVRVVTGELLSIASGSLSVNGELILDGSMDVVSGASLLPLGSTSGSGDATIARSTTFGVSDGQYSVIGPTVTSSTTDDLGSIVYEYDETVAYGTNGNNRFNLLGGSTALTIADGYFSANTGDISFIGTPNSGTKAISLVYDETNDGGSTNAGFNLVANPYPAAISYDNLMSGNTDIGTTLYFWDDGGSDVSQRTNSDYITATSMAAAGGGANARTGDWDGNIRSAQGFFVKATTAGTLSFTPSMMVTGNNTDAGFFRKVKPTLVRLALSNNDLSTNIVVGFTEEATLGFDRTLDGHKIKGNNNLQLYSRMNKEILAIQALPTLTEDITVDLGFDISESGTYTFDLPEELTYEFEIFLIDHKLDKVINLLEAGSYTFESEATNNSDRFSLLFSPNRILSIDDAKLTNNELVVFSNGSLLNIRVDQILDNAEVKIYDLSGTLVKQISQVNFTGEDVQTRFNGPGLYIMTVQTNDQFLVKRFINK